MSTIPAGGTTAHQRERATTIFEKGAPGRRAFRAPDLDVPQVDGLIPQRSRRVVERCADAGVNAGFALARAYDEHPDGLLVAITEQRSRADIDRLADVLGAAVAAERCAAEVAAHVTPSEGLSLR